MRNMLTIGLLIVALIIGLLVIKDMQSGPSPGMQKTEAIHKAEEAAQKVEQQSSKMQKMLQQAQKAIPDK